MRREHMRNYVCDKCKKEIGGEFFQVKVSGRNFDDWYDICDDCLKIIRGILPAKQLPRKVVQWADRNNLPVATAADLELDGTI